METRPMENHTSWHEGCIAEDPHCGPARRCAACQRYAAAMAALQETTTPMPAGLGERLRAIPGGEEQEQRRLHRYLAALAASNDPFSEREPPQVDAATSPAEEALDRRLSRFLAEARREQPVPPTLYRRLLRLANPRQALPFFLRDGQVAAAACLCLTLFATLWVGDASATLRAESPYPAQGLEWWAQGQEWLSSQTEDVLNETRETWQTHAARWADREEDWRARAFDRVRELRNTQLGRLVGLAFSQGAENEPQS